MSYTGFGVATNAPVAAQTASTTLFSAATDCHGRNVYNASTAVCYITYGTAASNSTAFTTQIAANANYAFPVPTYTGAVTAAWTAANGSAYTSQW